MHPAYHTNQWASGPSTHNRIYASALQEQDALFNSYEHLTAVPNSNEGLIRLRRMASLVKPIMRKRGWQVQVLTEFMPETHNLLGLNINKGYKICIRLRYSHDPSTFLPFEQTVDTMLHELSHIIWGAHDANFHRLWDELRDEHETLLLRGYTGEGFLSKGSRLGGGRIPPQSELRRLARTNAEKRRVLQKGSGRRVGGNTLNQNTDIRQVIADAAERRNQIDRGCASGTAEAGSIADQASRQAFSTKAEEDDANDRAIAEALLDLMEEEEAKKMHRAFTSPPPSGGLGWDPQQGLYSTEKVANETIMSEERQMKWALQESLKGNECLPNTGLEAHGSGKRDGSFPSPGSQTRAAKRSKSDFAPANVLRFRSPDALQSPPRYQAGSEKSPIDLVGPAPCDTWTCEICTCINPMQFLACDACAIERPPSIAKDGLSSRIKLGSQQSRQDTGWLCRECATFMEHKWWTCTECGLMKDSS